MTATVRPISEIAREIAEDWGKQGKGVNYAAVPYLQAMHSLESVRDPFYADSGASVVRYFLANANTWRGEKARAIKAELKTMVKGVY